METALGWVSTYGSVSLFFLLMLGIIGLPVPDETLLVFSGYLIYKGRLDPVFTFAMALAGSATGITVSYVLGRTFGYKLIHKYGRYFHLTEERLAKVHEWFERIGRFSLFFGYYIAGVRHFTAMVAGASALEYHVFAVFAYSGATTWVGLFLTLGYLVGESWPRVQAEVDRHLLLASIILAVLIGVGLLVRRFRKRS